MEALGFVLFLLNQTIAMVYAWFIVFGIGRGLATGITHPLRARYFGRKAYGSIQGVSRAAMAAVGIGAPIYLGWVYDSTGSYVSAFTLLTALITFGAVVMFLARPPTPPAEITDVRRFV